MPSGDFPCIPIPMFAKYIFIFCFSYDYSKLKQVIRCIFVKLNLCHFKASSIQFLSQSIIAVFLSTIFYYYFTIAVHTAPLNRNDAFHKC